MITEMQVSDFPSISIASVLLLATEITTLLKHLLLHSSHFHSLADKW